jgi:adenylosuccinate lyase
VELPTFDPGFSTSSTRAAFTAEQRVACMLAVEAALSGAQAAVGLVPPEAAAAIAAACASLRLPAASLLAAGWQVGTVVLPLCEALRGALPVEVARWVHLGATTQDIVDTALMLQARQGLDALLADMDRIASRCRTLAAAHRATSAQGRTFLQPAIPTTFGLRAARWLVSATDAARRLEETRGALPVQLGGPVGNLGAEGIRVQAELARALSLRAPEASWHTDRQPVHDLMAALTRASALAAKIALDVALLAQAEIGEVRFRAGLSSSMPHKANPIDAMRALAAAEAAAGVASVVTRGSPQALERGLGAWHAEAFAVPMVFHTVGAALEATACGLEDLEPDPARMAANLKGDAAAETEIAAALVDRLLERTP